MSATRGAVEAVRNVIERYARLLFALGVAAGLVYFERRLPIPVGDSVEYWATLQAWFNHGTPDIRRQDLDELGRLFEAHGVAPAARAKLRWPALMTTASGVDYTLHFWMYSLVALPAKIVLRLVRGNELAALQVTNFLLFALVLYVLLFKSRADRGWRWRFAGLVCVGPMLWYLLWAHTEIYTWAGVCLALVALEQRRYGWATLSASMGALQNPPLVSLVAFLVLLAWVDRSRSGRWTSLLGAAASLITPLFFFINYGEPNLHRKVGGADFAEVSFNRTWSTLFDLNQGLLPYAPGFLLLLGIAVVRLARQRNWRVLGMVAVGSAMVTAVGAVTNWNCGTAGILRYWVWLIPPFAWTIAHAPPPGRWAPGLIGATLATNLAIVAGGSIEERYLEQTALAKFVLQHAPALYNPEPEIFVERQRHNEDPYWAQPPVEFALESGEVTKLLVHGCDLDHVARRFRVDPAYLSKVKQEYGQREGMFYLNPPRGAVRNQLNVPDRLSTTFLSRCNRPETGYKDDDGYVQAITALAPQDGLILEVPGREHDPLQNDLLSQKPSELVETLALEQYAGISVDRLRAGERMPDFETGLKDLLARGPSAESGDGRWAYYDLIAYRERRAAGAPH